MSHAPDGQQQPYRSEGPYQQQPYGEPYDQQYGQQYGQQYEQQYGRQDDRPLPPPPGEPRRPSRVRRWVIAGASVLALAAVASLVMSHYEIPPFTDKGDSVSFCDMPRTPYYGPCSTDDD
ncbi:hypothetical protein ACFWAX_27975, partial [Streptomyces sp. NPDC059956]